MVKKTNELSNNSTKVDLSLERESVKKQLKKELAFKQILGTSKAIQRLHAQIKQLSACDVNVLISGESGTGKELAARSIHYLSSRADKPFIPINCGAIPENIFENELFGHIKGAFTDACSNQSGLIREAEGGTLFLDEMDAVSPYIQVKFLRLLQEKEYKPLGDSKSRKANVRIIAATNKNLSSLVKKGDFREDLFYRLNVVSLNIPPLRERKEDIPVLAEHLLQKYSRQYNKPGMVFSPTTTEALLSYSWPGNIRELENKIQQIVVMSNSQIVKPNEFNLPENKTRNDNHKFDYFNIAKQKAIYDFEKTYLIRVLTEQHGNVVNAAEKAGKSRTALWNLLKKHDISPKQFR